jgi:ABC-type branched-subunit amino acid transport system substrate-binding protein
MRTNPTTREALALQQAAINIHRAITGNNPPKATPGTITDHLFTAFSQEVKNLWRTTHGQSWVTACYMAGRTAKLEGVTEAPKRFREALMTPAGFLSNFAWRVGNRGGVIDDVRHYVEQAL